MKTFNVIGDLRICDWLLEKHRDLEGPICYFFLSRKKMSNSLKSKKLHSTQTKLSFSNKKLITSNTFGQ